MTMWDQPKLPKRPLIHRNKWQHDGEYYYVPPWNTRSAPPAAATDIPWCLQDRKRWGEVRQTGVVRCPDCGRRVTLMMVDVEDGYGDFQSFLPPHKIRATHFKHKNVKKLRALHKKKGLGARRGQ